MLLETYSALTHCHLRHRSKINRPQAHWEINAQGLMADYMHYAQILQCV